MATILVPLLSRHPIRLIKSTILLLKQTLRPPNHNHVLKYTYVQKILEILDISIAQSIKSVTDLKALTDRETLALLYEANVFSNDMQRTVYDLQKILIRTFKDGAIDTELDGAVKEFSQFAYSLQQCFNEDPDMLKNQIIGNLSKIMIQARRLVTSVQGNRNREYIHEIVGIVDDILFAVQKIGFRNKFENDTPDSLIMQTIKYKDGIIDKFNSFKHINHSVLRDVRHSIRQSVEKTLRIVKELDEKADNYSEDIKKVLFQASCSVMADMAEVDASLRCKNDVNVLKSYSMIAVRTVCLELENLLELLKIKIQDEQVANNLHNLVILVLVNELAAADQFIRHIEYASNQIDD